MKSIRIAGVTWRIEHLSQGELFEKSGEDLLGYCAWPDCVIRLRADMPADRAATVLLHEILHAIADDADLNLPEGALRKLSTGLFEVMRNNPALIKLVANARSG